MRSDPAASQKPAAAEASPPPAGRIDPADAPKVQSLTTADEFELAFAGIAYDVAPTTEPTPAKKAPSFASALGSPQNPIVLDEDRPRHQRVKPKRDYGSQLKDLYLPLIMIAAGLVLSFVAASLSQSKGPLPAFAIAIISMATDVVVVFGAMFAAASMLDLGLGAMGPAVLKLLAIAILPGAIADLLGRVTTDLESLALNWGICLFLYYALMSYLFEMDGGEIRVATGIIFIARIATYLLLAAIFMRHTPLGPRPTPKGPQTTAAANIAANNDARIVAFNDQHAKNTIADRNAIEAMQWCDYDRRMHVGARMSNAALRKLTEQFYAAGAKKVWVADLKATGDLYICQEMLVEMPDDPQSRRQTLAVMDAFSKAPTPSTDLGNHYLDLSLK